MSYRSTHPTPINIPYVKSKRALLGMTQEDLATYLGMNAKSLSKYMHGGNMPITALFEMADLFGCQAEDLVLRERKTQC